MMGTGSTGKLALLLAGFACTVGFLSCGGTSSSSTGSHTLASVTITPASPTVDLGLTRQLSATANYSDNSTQDVTASTTWSSGNTAQASFSQSTPGLVSGVAAGSPKITAAYGGMSGTATLTVEGVSGLALTPSDPSIPVNSTQQFKATATYQDNSTGDVTSLAAWASSDNTKATISNAGLATAISAKSPYPNIQAGFAGSTALTILTITSTAPQTDLKLSVVDPYIAPGATLQLIAVADFSDGSSQTVTSSTTWSSDASGVASVGATTGLVTAGNTSGVAHITGTYGTCNNVPCTATAPITVNSAAVTVPLSDMTQSGKNYLGFTGGLYGSNSNTVPTKHDSDGKALAGKIQPLDQSGNATSNGTIVFLGIGMSNAFIEFGRFVSVSTAAGSGVNQTTLAVENGAHGAVTACPWTVAQGLAGPVCGATGVPAENQYDRVRDTVLATATTAPNVPAGCGTTSSPCLTEAQVQVIWMKNANPDPGLDGIGSMSPTTNCAAEVANAPAFLTESCRYEWQMGEIVRAAKSRYPNLKLIFFTTRIYAGYATSALNPEPYAYEYGFSGQWLVNAQIAQVGGAGADAVAGDLCYSSNECGSTVGTWVGWGPYLWADGTTKRGDGLNWCNAQAGSPCNGEQDFEPDGTHPSSNNPTTPPYDGAYKFVSASPWGMMNFFLTSPYTCPWFSATPASCP